MRKLLTALALALPIALTACSDRGDPPTTPLEPSTSTVVTAPSAAELAQTAQDMGYVPGRVLARFRSGASIAALAGAQGAGVQRSLTGGTRVLNVPVGREAAVAEALSRNPMVEFAEPDLFYTLDFPCGTGTCTETTDPLFSFKWDLHNSGTIRDGTGNVVATTGQPDADMDWAEAFDALGPLPGSAVIGIIDTGIRATHEDLAGKYVGGYDFFAMDPDPTDDNGHGTHVAGIAAGSGNNGTGVPGVAWMPEVQIVSAKVCGLLYGFLYGCPSSAIADGIMWATDNGANVLNISLGGPDGSAEVQSALQYARQNGVLPICAAGNDAGAVGFPAGFPECVAISSTNWSDELASYSNFGPQIQLAAPGGDFEDPNDYSFIVSSHNSSDTGYVWLLGTSMASPQAAGLAGLLHALGVTDDDDKLTRMRSTANDLGAPGDDDLFGAGRINVYTAIADLIGAPTNQSPTAAFSVNCTELACNFTDTSTDGEGSVVAWSWDLDDGATSIQQNPSHTYSVEGTYTVTVTATDDEGLTGSASATFTVPIPNLPPTAAFTSSCFGYSCAFTDTSTDTDGTLVAWAWDFGDGNVATGQNPSHTYAVAGTYTVTFTATDDDGDADSTTGTVSASEPNQPPVAGFTYQCAALTCSFTDTSSDPDGTINSYMWQMGDGLSTNAQNPTYTYGSPGTYTVTHWVYDNGAASDTVSTNVTLFAPGEAPTASFTVNCTDLTCNFTDTSTDDQGSVVSWDWDFGDGATSTDQHPTHSYATAGTFTVSLTATDDVGASGDFARGVIVPSGNQPPTAAFTSNCTDLTCGFTDTSADGDGTVVSWAWDFGDGSTSTVQHPTHSYSATGTYTVTLTSTDDGGATDAATAPVSVVAPNAPPVAGFTYQCTDLACSFTTTSTDSDGTVAIYQWNMGDGVGTNAVNPSHTYAASGTYTVTHLVYDNGGASDTVSTAVTVFSPGEAPTASFVVSCAGRTCDFTDESTDNQGSVVSWAWDLGDGNTSSAQHPTHTYASDGTYTVTLTATDDVGASDAFSRSVIVPSGNQPPAVSFTSSCTDLTCGFTDTSADGDGTMVSWAWDFGDGTTATDQHPTHVYGLAGTYTVTLTATDDGGASDVATSTVVVVEPNEPPVAGFTYACSGLGCTFTDTSTDSDGTVTVYQWNMGDGVGTNARNPSHTYAAPGTYTVTHWVYDNGAASDTVSQAVTVGEAPFASFNATCTDLDCGFTDTSTDGDGTVVFWSWDFGDGGTSFAQNPTHTYAAAGSYNVTLAVQDNDGAAGSATQVVSVSAPQNQAPTASFASSCTELACGFTDGSTDSDGTIISWSWAFGDGATANSQNPTRTYGAAGTYTVTLTVQDNDGAQGTTTQSVTASDPPNQAPTASFGSSCTDLACGFTDGSTDSDGNVVAWSWAFGDGATANTQSPTHTYGAAGTYTVTLTVTDDDGATDVSSQALTVSAPPVAITLSAAGYKVKGRHQADLTWGGATSSNVDVYRNGAVVLTTANDGSQTDVIGTRGSATYTYQICEAGTTTCSPVVTVTF